MLDERETHHRIPHRMVTNLLTVSPVTTVLSGRNGEQDVYREDSQPETEVQRWLMVCAKVCYVTQRYMGGLL